MSKQYRVTWRHEAYITANSAKEVLQLWESLDLGNLNTEVADGEIDSHSYVSGVTLENDDDEDVISPEDIAYEMLSTDDESLTIKEMIAAIEAQDKIDGSQLIDYVEGVYVWEKIELEFTCNDFLIYIGKKQK